MMLRKAQEQPNYLALVALANGTFTLTIGASVTLSDLAYVEYSTDEGETWVKTDNVASTAVTITTPTITQGNRVLWRGSGTRTARGTSSGNYSYFSATCNHNVEGHVCSLIYGSSKNQYDTISANYTFVGLFYGDTKLISSEGLVLPSNATQYCYNRFFRDCTSHSVTFAEIKAPTLYAYSMNNMYYNNSVLERSPDILSNTATGNYVCGSCFQNCKKLKYIKCLFTSRSSSTGQTWVASVASSGIFVKHINATWTVSGNNGVPSGWTIINYNPSTGKYYLEDKTTECDDHGNVINN